MAQYLIDEPVFFKRIFTSTKNKIDICKLTTETEHNTLQLYANIIRNLTNSIIFGVHLCTHTHIE